MLWYLPRYCLPRFPENDSGDDGEASEKGSDDDSHNREANLAMQKELIRKYERFLARCDQTTLSDEQVDLIVISDKPLGPLTNVYFDKVLSQMLLRTNEKIA